MRAPKKTPQQARKEAALKLAVKLDAAVEAFVELRKACTDCGDNMASYSNALKTDMDEYAHWIRQANWIAS